MHFASGVVRPPYERDSAFLQVTTGCTHDACKFCTYYKGVPFTVSPLEEVAQDVDELAALSGRWPFDRIFLQGADPFVLKADRLEKIAAIVHGRLPQVRGIGGYGRVDSLRNKTVDDLKRLKAAGYDMIVFGIESGDDAVLQAMNKGYGAADIVEQLSKMDQAGMRYTCIFLSGLGGHGYGLGHARKTADVLNRLHPARVIASELTLFDDTPLMDDVRAGTFVEANEAEKLAELVELVGALKIPTVFDAMNASVVTPVFGELPRDRERLLGQLADALERVGEEGLAARRAGLQAI